MVDIAINKKHRTVMNVLAKSTLRSCTSCGACATVCVKRAISIQLNKDGFYRPVINDTLCNDCGLCTTVCYKYDGDVRKTNLNGLKDKPLYAAWSIDDDIVKKSSSGGMGDLLAHQLFHEGYKVVGVVYNEDKIRAEQHIANCEEDLLAFRGSKYIQSYTYDAFKEIVVNCRNEKYAVFGTPCQIYALNRVVATRNIRDNFFFVDLYCHGCPSLHVWSKYQTDIKKKNALTRFDSVSFRSKVNGWGSFIIEAFANGKQVYVSRRVNDKFYELFFSNQVLNDACSDCMLRSSLEYTDIRIGDFWGYKFIHNQRGVSAVSLVTDRGKEVFEKIGKSIVCMQCSYNEFLPFQSWGITYKTDSDKRNDVLASLSNPENDLDVAIELLRQHQGVTTKAKRYLKACLALFPQGLTNSIKKMVYKILYK